MGIKGRKGRLNKKESINQESDGAQINGNGVPGVWLIEFHTPQR